MFSVLAECIHRLKFIRINLRHIFHCSAPKTPTCDLTSVLNRMLGPWVSFTLIPIQSCKPQFLNLLLNIKLYEEIKRIKIHYFLVVNWHKFMIHFYFKIIFQGPQFYSGCDVTYHRYIITIPYRNMLRSNKYSLWSSKKVV